MLVDALRPYQRNEISLDPTQVPMDGAIDQSAIGVTPAYRSGALVRFPVTRAMAATARLVQRDGTPVPAGATATFTGAGTEFPVALDGLLYVEGLQCLDPGARHLAGRRVPSDIAPPGRAATRARPRHAAMRVTHADAPWLARVLPAGDDNCAAQAGGRTVPSNCHRREFRRLRPVPGTTG